MKFIHELDTNTKLYASCAIFFGLGALINAWLITQLGPLGELGVQAGRATGSAAAKASGQLQSEISSLRTWAAVLVTVGLGVAALVCSWLIAEIARPVHKAVEFARRIAAGDLSSKVATSAGGDAGLLLRTLQEMNDKLADMMGNLRSGTEQIVHGAGDIAAGSMDLSARTERQAASLEQTATSMEELTATVKQNADHALQANKLAISASEVAVKGGEVVSEVVGTMASINDSSKRIAEIIGVIDGIAFQTNILALNAAVEAARAGEQGRGFAVVASEVRSLAQRSAAAAKEIKELIDDSVEKVNAGTQLADKAGNTMNEVVTSVKRVTGIISEIADASAEQTVGIEQVNQAIAAMDQATQQNAALVEQSTAAAASMREQAASLTRLVGAFAGAREPGKAASADKIVPAKPAKKAAAGSKPQARPQAQAQPQRAAQPDAASPARSASARKAAAATGTHGNAQRFPTPDVDWEEF
jgi:methyl-accepting chemotaxis protein